MVYCGPFEWLNKSKVKHAEHCRDRKHDGNSRGRGFGRGCGVHASGGKDHRHAPILCVPRTSSGVPKVKPGNIGGEGRREWARGNATDALDRSMERSVFAE